MKPVITAVFTVAAAIGTAIHRPDIVWTHATAVSSPCILSSTGVNGGILIASDIADTGKRSRPKNANDLFKRPNERQLAATLDARLAFSADTSNGTLATSDAANDPLVLRLPLRGRAASKAFDAVTGCMWVSVPERHELVAIDRGAAAVTETFTLDAGALPTELLVDRDDRFLFVTNAANATIEVLNLESTVIMDIASTDRPVRGLAFDSAWHRLYVLTTDGGLSGYELRRSRLFRTGTLEQTAGVGVAVDQETHAVYISTARDDEPPAIRVLQGKAPAKPRCVFSHSSPNSPCLAKYALSREAPNAPPKPVR